MISLVLVAIAQLLDLVTLFAGLAIGTGSLESNAAIRWSWAVGGPFLVIAVKSVLIVAMLFGVDYLGRSPLAWVRVAGPTLGVGIGLAGASANIAVLAVVVLVR